MEPGESANPEPGWPDSVAIYDMILNSFNVFMSTSSLVQLATQFRHTKRCTAGSINLTERRLNANKGLSAQAVRFHFYRTRPAARLHARSL
jgi:hypothetical protein